MSISTHNTEIEIMNWWDETTGFDAERLPLDSSTIEGMTPAQQTAYYRSVREDAERAQWLILSEDAGLLDKMGVALDTVIVPEQRFLDY